MLIYFAMGDITLGKELPSKDFSPNWIEPVSGCKGIRKYKTIPPIELNQSLILRGYMSTYWTEPFSDSKDIGKTVGGDFNTAARV